MRAQLLQHHVAVASVEEQSSRCLWQGLCMSPASASLPVPFPF